MRSSPPPRLSPGRRGGTPPDSCWNARSPPTPGARPPGGSRWLPRRPRCTTTSARQARWAPDAIAAAEAATGPQDRWQLDFLEVEHDYGRELIGEDGSPRFGPDGHDPARLAALAQRAEALVHAAPDVASAGWAAFYRGLISDNLIGDRDRAPRWLTQALDAAEQTGDDYLAGEALRHLGDHDEEAGDLEQARLRWERSAQLWARAGNMAGVLAQQLLLAQLAIRQGKAAAGSAIAQEAGRWAGAVGLSWCQKQADALLAGERDPA